MTLAKVSPLVILILIEISRSQSEAPKCPDGWKSLNDRCFFYDTNVYESRHIVEACQFHLGQPASIHSAEENKFVQALITGKFGTQNKSSVNFDLTRKRACLVRILFLSLGLEGQDTIRLPQLSKI